MPPPPLATHPPAQEPYRVALLRAVVDAQVDGVAATESPLPVGLGRRGRGLAKGGEPDVLASPIAADNTDVMPGAITPLRSRTTGNAVGVTGVATGSRAASGGAAASALPGAAVRGNLRAAGADVAQRRLAYDTKGRDSEEEDDDDSEEEEGDGSDVDDIVAAPATASGLKTNRQTTDDVLRATNLRAYAAPRLRQVFGVARLSMPCAVPFPSPIEADGPPVAEVLLVVDSRETVGKGPSRDAMLSRLRIIPGLVNRVVKRRLPAGDAVLVARVTSTGEAIVRGAPRAGTELVLDQLIERKTADDLAMSLRDGRLREQTYYMAATGCSALTCIVEGELDETAVEDDGMRAEAESFLAQLTVSSKFMIKRTAGFNETAMLYASLVRTRGRRLGNADGFAAWLSSTRFRSHPAGDKDGLLTFPMWEEAMRALRETVTLQQMWAMQLHVMPGVVSPRINRIKESGHSMFPALHAAYRAASSPAEARTMLAKLVPPPGHAPVSKKLSEFVYLLYSLEEFGERAGRRNSAS